MLYCDRCARRTCASASVEGLPEVCPTRDADARRRAARAYEGDDLLVSAASHVATRDGYGWATRVEEVMLYAARAGARRIGVAFCITLAREARAFCDILRDNGFAVSSVMCKAGALPREALGVPEACDVLPGMASALCDPVGQAQLLNAEGTDLNVVVGLCVGHDSLFFRHSDAPATCLVVKDRMTGHNPLAPVYQHEGAFHRVHRMDLPEALDPSFSSDAGLRRGGRAR
ncbi:hypothetical protein B5F40_12905 [Gordonibacter sp. An230]|uniref:DUF1847 domain-containing protein n=1 Tax=Gordonibacter sp. An230 TaxID=1965592 RepID=UPI000B3ACA16|nr:DUF1847 domain-containing protein [Gordonibacter sp. An230]OUO88038.1 hypothetical protein B5F40_12905 [Gordonibacter sp. An230]